jgi:hypothetical protein
MPSYDYVYGSRVIVQCKKQVNPQVWKDDPTYSRYLKEINKRENFYNYWYKLRTDIQCRVREPPNEAVCDEIKKYVGTEIDDVLRERTRVVCWSIDEMDKSVVRRGGGHRGQSSQEIAAFCARDQGLNIKLPEYTST